ncbi:MAG: holo-ACP synthase [Gammaproteobacteria bacterium]|jgi:holo-[acyl-carrier protein] synthase|nr:holo-ACP synthase [Gammaproteobacteria bacterium]|tara:strand:+ start:233 stop:619 length:387 start_codon:yes stop_codon:yes gene_type:complete
MSIFGIGVDMVNIDRVKKIHEKYGDRFVSKILNYSEIELYKKANDPHQFLANRFAGKEAASKALGTGISKGVTWKDFGIVSKPSGQPELLLSENMKKLFESEGIAASHVSLTDEKPWSMAFVILERNQ